MVIVGGKIWFWGWPPWVLSGYPLKKLDEKQSIKFWKIRLTWEAVCGLPVLSQLLIRQV